MQSISIFTDKSNCLGGRCSFLLSLCFLSFFKKKLFVPHFYSSSRRGHMGESFTCILSVPFLPKRTKLLSSWCHCHRRVIIHTSTVLSQNTKRWVTLTLLYSRTLQALWNTVCQTGPTQLCISVLQASPLNLPSAMTTRKSCKRHIVILQIYWNLALTRR